MKQTPELGLLGRGTTRSGRSSARSLAAASACAQPCNRKKGAEPVETFLARKPESLKRILAQVKRPLRDAAAVNATRWELKSTLEARLGIPVAVATGGRTKWNRARLGLPKTHSLDARKEGPSI
ncbi:hypothetical protein ACEUZ9_001074 [Paracoccus litorisediminis]|uniref:hypothetical protein n=1 Tax=Paracoccus litorisediminis TaxID=2006130 RepID=UPI003734438E